MSAVCGRERGSDMVAKGINQMSQVPKRRNTRQRELVLASVEHRCDHPSADDVYEEVHKEDPHISRATVYRNLHLLVDAGRIISIHTENGERFDRRLDDHAHVVCERCGRVADVPAPRLDEADGQAASSTGFQVRGHELVFFGVCPACQRKGGGEE